jgi:hypothetical protein
MTQQFSTNLSMPALPETEDPKLFASLLPLHNAMRNLAINLDTSTGRTFVPPDEYSKVSPYVNIASNVLYVLFSEDVLAGHLITFADVSGTLVGKKATGPVQADFARAFSMSERSAGEVGPVGLFGLDPYINGLTPGTPYYLSSTPGLLSPSSGYHYVGVALAPDKLWFSPSF